MSDAYTDEGRRERGAQRWIEAQKARREAQVRSGVLDLVRHSGLNAIAEECHRLACLRLKYPDGWTVQTGWMQVYMELLEWVQEAKFKGKRDEAERIEYGDLLHTVLSLGSHMGYDVEQELRDAMQRNAARARRGRVMEPGIYGGYIVLTDGTGWPNPIDPEEVEWRMRHAPDTITRQDLMWAASVVNAYKRLVLDTTQNRRNKVCAGVRSLVTKEG